MFVMTALKKLRGVWERLTWPAAGVQKDEQRQQASLLAALSAVLFGVGIIILTIWVVANPDFKIAPAIAIGTLTIIAIVYILSRTRLYVIGAFLLIAMLLFMVAAIIVTAPYPMTERMLALYFLAVAILLTSMLFNIRVTLFVATVCITLTMLFFFVPGVPFAVTYSYQVFMVIMSSLLIVATIIRNNYIMARQEAETALRESEARFHNMFAKHAAVMLLIEPATGEIIDANQAAERFYGYPVSRLCTMNIAELNMLSPDQILLVRQKALQKERDYFTFPQRLANGDVRMVEVHSSPIALENKEMLFSIIHDITERERAATTLVSRTGELNALQATILDITSPQPLSVLLHIIVERAAKLLNSTSGGMYLTEPERHQVRCVVSYNTSSDFTGTRLNYGEGAAGYVAQTGQPLIIDDYRTWSGRASVFEGERPFQTVMSAPLLWQGNVTGVIHVLREEIEEPFSPEDLDLLMMFANHAAVAVENARLRSNLEQELAERKQAETERERLIGELKTALARVKQLSGLLPICASCKKIRDDEGYWQDVVVYIDDHSEAEFSHSICPECMKKLYPDFYHGND